MNILRKAEMLFYPQEKNRVLCKEHSENKEKPMEVKIGWWKFLNSRNNWEKI